MKKNQTEDYDNNLGYEDDDDALNKFVDVLLHAAFILGFIGLTAGLFFLCWLIQ
jgi:vacuolar-type H+-ATPase subunit I/STV1